MWFEVVTGQELEAMNGFLSSLDAGLGVGWRGAVEAMDRD